uniref:GspE/PulE family protein n=1 Tax=Klebsiella pneumoniae TaxID=573 RepID=UPI003D35ED7D
MNSIDKNPSPRLRQQRAAIDGDMSRDRGRLLGMLSRCPAKPQDAALAATFEQALQASVQRRQLRAQQQPSITLDPQLPIAREADAIIKLIRDHQVVVIAGETGSGKTTTLYSTLKRLATPDVNVCTVEDPIEMIAPEFNQMQVQTNIDLDFASGVRTLLRQDPDIIMIGEIRDLETAQMAVQASLTGHLVLSTL